MKNLTERLMLDIIIESGPPLAFIDSKREIIFSTKSFDELLGLKNICVNCQSVLVAAFKQYKENACCWDVLKPLIDDEEPGIWLVTGKDERYFSMLSKVKPVTVNNRNIGFLLEVRPIEYSYKKGEDLAHRFIENAISNLDNKETALEFLTNILLNDYSPDFLCWTYAEKGSLQPLLLRGSCPDKSLREVVLERLEEALLTFNYNLPFDLLVKECVFHVFPQGDYSVNGGCLHLILKGLPFNVDTSDVKKIRHLVDIASIIIRKERILKDRHEPHPIIVDVLSERQKKVISLVCEGLSDKEIAKKLYISPYTVKNHVNIAMNKLGVRKRTQLVNLYTRFTK